jgi:hypothetical protein
MGPEFAPFGGPVGWVGWVGDLAIIPELSLVGGIGKGAASIQWSVGLRPRWPMSARMAPSVTLAYSHGSYVTLSGELENHGDDVWKFQDGSWMNVDVGIDFRIGPNLAARPFFGGSQLVHSAPPIYSGPHALTAPKERWPVLPYHGVSVAFAF